MKPASVLDYRDAARRRLPKFLFEYIDGGSYSETTLRRNSTELQRVALRQRVGLDVSSIDLSVSLFNQAFSLPVALAPVGLAGMNARRGEVQAVKAAEAANVPFCLSTVGACSLREVAGASIEPFWFQLYMVRDRAFMRDLLAEATDSGCSALIFTMDMPVPGSRYRDYRSGLAGSTGLVGNLRRFAQASLRPRWAWDVGIMGRPHGLGNVAPLLGKNTGLEDFMAWMKANFDPSTTWDDLEFVREHWGGPIIIKGILDRADAIIACENGVDGIIVSNHGGRQLDGVPSTASVLSGIADSVGKSTVVLADGGVYSGLDVVRMLALGADAVLVGRAWAYALGARGQSGIEHVLAIIEDEMRVAMALTGCTSIDQIGREILVNSPATG